MPSMEELVTPISDIDVVLHKAKAGTRERKLQLVE